MGTELSKWVDEKKEGGGEEEREKKIRIEGRKEKGWSA